jgi:hypothetical protein
MKTIRWLAGPVVSVILIRCALAQTFPTVVYDGGVNNLGLYVAGFPGEVGDSVTLSGTPRALRYFEASYTSRLRESPDKTGFVRIYANDADGKPDDSRLLWQSPVFELFNFAGNSGGRVTFSGLEGVTFADSVTWSLTPQGLLPDEWVGFFLYGSPLAGSGSPNYWLRDASGGWTAKLVNGGSIPAHFYARILAADVVPEPAPIQLCLLAGLTLLGVRLSSLSGPRSGPTDRPPRRIDPTIPPSLPPRS